MTKRIFMKRSKPSTCRELLNQSRNLSFVVYGNYALDHLHDELVKLIEPLKYRASKYESLILGKTNVVRNVSKSSKFSTLPKPKLKMSNLTGRVAISAERNRKVRSITIIDPKIKKANIIEGQPCFDPNDVYDIPMKETIKDLSNVTDSATDSDGRKDCSMFDFEILEKENPKSGLNKAIPETERFVLEEDIFTTKEVPASGNKNANRNLKFTNEERKILQKHMLSDESINLAQILLKEQFPEIFGFQDTVFGRIQSFNMVKTDENFIQLLHVGSLHWVCVANVSENKSRNGECQLYDSLFHGKFLQMLRNR